MSTSTGTLDSSISYFPFGLTRTGSVSTDKKFTGQRLDATGLYYYGARYYDATIGRFISADTVIQSLANPQTLNRYTYCSNNPLKYTDPTGHEYVYVTNEGLNDNGEFWYCVYSDKEHKNIIAIVTGADNLAARYSDFSIENDLKSATLQLNTPAYQIAKKTANLSGTYTENVFFGYDYFGFTDDDLLNNGSAVSNSSTSGIATAITLGIVGKTLGDSEQPGSYIVFFDSGMMYIGKGTESRMWNSVDRIESITGDKALTVQWDPAISDRQAFIDEYYKMLEYDYPTNSGSFYNQIMSPGKAYYEYDNNY